jgi:hypothetical protein
VKSKIIIHKNVTEQVNTFNYPRCSISQQNEKEHIVKISKFLQIKGNINRTLKPSRAPKHTRMKIYSTLLLPTLLYGCESWAIIEQDKYRINTGKIQDK